MSPGGRGAGLAVSRTGEPGAEWDAFVRRSQGATFCHLAAWAGVMADVMGRTPLYLEARESDGELAGVLPLVEVRSRLFGHFLVSMPFLNYGGPVGSGQARRLLARKAVERARERGADLLELRVRNGAGGGDADAHALDGELQPSRRKVTVLLPLPDDPEVLWKDGLRSKVRSQVRKPMKEGLEVRFGQDQVAPFYHVFNRHMRDLGTPVLPLRLFEALPGAFGDAVAFACVYRAGEPVAGGCGFHFEGEFEITWASALREHGRVAPNMLLYWRMMERAIERGDRVFNFGRCTPGGSTHRFKLQWGGEDEPLPWAAWSADGRGSTPNPDEDRYDLATRVWSRLPASLTRTLGPPLARRIP